MLENIKSIYFIKIIFSLLEEEIKLKIVKYNKSLQNIININIINYKLFKGKYIIYGTDKVGKEYDFYDSLLFEGEYLDGERNGKGKEYFNGVLIYEGYYLNGKRNGRGKGYDYNSGDLEFEGEYFNGKINGKIKEYWFGKLEFEGEFINDKRNGTGKEYYDNGKIKFEGKYLDNKRNGKGKEYNRNGELIYEGEYIDGEKIGKIYDANDNIIDNINNINGFIKEYYYDNKLKNFRIF